jgi:hypothetical protein
MKSKMDKFELHRAIPYREALLPSLAKDRQESAEPSVIWSSNEKLEPSFTMPYTLQAEPRRVKLRMESDDPNWK